MKTSRRCRAGVRVWRITSAIIGTAQNRIARAALRPSSARGDRPRHLVEPPLRWLASRLRLVPPWYPRALSISTAVRSSSRAGMVTAVLFSRHCDARAGWVMRSSARVNSATECINAFSRTAFASPSGVKDIWRLRDGLLHMRERLKPRSPRCTLSRFLLLDATSRAVAAPPRSCFHRRRHSASAATDPQSRRRRRESRFLRPHLNADGGEVSSAARRTLLCATSRARATPQTEILSGTRAASRPNSARRAVTVDIGCLIRSTTCPFEAPAEALTYPSRCGNLSSERCRMGIPHAVQIS